jgi:anionic cell wall polymer biosynthesis LytR-Cps2A-Psr (LCP) family protein
MAPWEGGEISLEQALRGGGPKGLKSAVEALTEGTVDRYIAGGDSGFVRAVNLLRDATKRSVTVQLDEGIDYNDRAGLSLRLAKGDNPLTGDSLLRYFRYLATLGEDGVRAQGELLARVLETYLTREIGAQQLETLFNGLMNILQTDISVSDFFTRRDLLLAIPAEGGQFTVDVKE